MDIETVRDLLRESTFPYLAAYENEWINSEGTIEFDEMGKKHLKNCLAMLEEQRYTVEHGFVLENLEYDKAQYNEILNTVKELYYKKIEEIKKYLKQ